MSERLDISGLCPIGQQIARDLIARLYLGLERQGPWKRKDFRREAFEELLDLIIYEAAERVYERKEGGGHGAEKGAVGGEEGRQGPG